MAAWVSSSGPSPCSRFWSACSCSSALLLRRSSADLVDWKPTRSPEVEAQNEIDDVRQMVEAQNEMRRRRGAPEISEESLRQEVAAEEIEKLRRKPFEVE